MEMEDDEEKFATIPSVIEFCKNEEALMAFLRTKNILGTSYSCPKCSTPMKLTPTKKVKDGIEWKCSRKVGHADKKQVTRTIRRGTWFARSSMSISKIFMLTYLWILKFSNHHVRDVFPSMGKHTIVDWFNSCREVVTEIMITRDNKIGGPGHIVEIDESKFGIRKYHRGNSVDGQWIFGGIDRDTKEIFIAAVEDRKPTTLFPVIQSRIHPGTTIYSDSSPTYRKLQRNGTGHLTVNNSRTFKDPGAGCHRNTIESLWRAIKASLPKSSRNKLLYSTYLIEYVYRRWRLDGLSNGAKFLCFLEDIAKVYRPHTEDKPKEEEEEEEEEVEGQEEADDEEVVDDVKVVNDMEVVDEFELVDVVEVVDAFELVDEIEVVGETEDQE